MTVATTSGRPSGMAFGVDPLRVPGGRAGRRQPAALVTLPVAMAVRRCSGFDVVHAHGDSQLLWRRRTPVVRTFHGSAREEAVHAGRTRRRIGQAMQIPGEALARRMATVTVGVSKNTEASIGPLDLIIPCGVDIDHFAPSDKSMVPSILFVGTLQGRKRGAMLVQLFSSAILPAVPNTELWVVSNEPVAGPGVRWFGRVGEDDIRRLFASAWVFCLPSAYEGFGVPYIEAMASGTAVIATPNPGAAELAGDDSGVVVVSEADLAAEITCLLTNADRRQFLERRGRSYVRRFAWPQVASEYESAYALALQRRIKPEASGTICREAL